MNLTTWTAVGGLFLGAVGTGLGIYNARIAYLRDKIRLNLEVLENRKKSGEVYCGIAVINNSSFPVAIEEVGFLISCGRGTIEFGPDRMTLDVDDFQEPLAIGGKLATFTRLPVTEIPEFRRLEGVYLKTGDIALRNTSAGAIKAIRDHCLAGHQLMAEPRQKPLGS